MRAVTRILRLPQVQVRVGLSVMTIWRRQKDGTFPHRVRLGPNSVGWVEEEIEAWCAQRIADSRPEAVDADTCGFRACGPATMTTSKTHANVGAPLDALAIVGLLAIMPMVAIGTFDVCGEPQGAVFFSIGSVIAVATIYPLIALFVRQPWRFVVSLLSGLLGTGIYVCSLDLFNTGDVWNVKYYGAIVVFLAVALVPTAFSAAIFLLAGHNIFGIPLIIFSFGDVPPTSVLWRLAEAYRRKAVERRCEALEKEERLIRAETAIEQSLIEKRLTSAKLKYLDNLTDSERATLQQRMEAMARVDACAACDFERVEAENAELRRMLAAAGIKATA